MNRLMKLLNNNNSTIFRLLSEVNKFIGCLREKRQQPFARLLPQSGLHDRPSTELLRLDNPDDQELALSENAKAVFQANRTTDW